MKSARFPIRVKLNLTASGSRRAFSSRYQSLHKFLVNGYLIAFSMRTNAILIKLSHVELQFVFFSLPLLAIFQPKFPFNCLNVFDWTRKWNASLCCCYSPFSMTKFCVKSFALSLALRWNFPSYVRCLRVFKALPWKSFQI